MSSEANNQGGAPAPDNQGAADAPQADPVVAAAQPEPENLPAVAGPVPVAIVAPVPFGTTILGFSIPQVVTFLGMVAGAVIPGAEVAGFTIDQLLKLALGIYNNIPEAMDAFDEIKAVATSGLPPTAEQMASWNAAADSAHANLQATAQAVIAKGS